MKSLFILPILTLIPVFGMAFSECKTSDKSLYYKVEQGVVTELMIGGQKVDESLFNSEFEEDGVPVIGSEPKDFVGYLLIYSITESSQYLKDPIIVYGDLPLPSARTVHIAFINANETTFVHCTNQSAAIK